MTNKESILKIAQNYDVISFDVFDTLLIRDVRIPADVFTLAYGTFGRYVRILAEMKARRMSKTGEVTLGDIDKYCQFSCSRELDFEKAYCRANPVMLEIYKTLRESGKKIYAISDMYLSSEFISHLLINSGYNIPVLVSCEEGCTKKDGLLFNRFLNKYSIKNDQVLHIGDNNESDGEGARKAGIKSYIVEKHSYGSLYTKYNKKKPEYSAFINHGLNEISDPLEKIGYEIVGPIILSFCQWVHKKKAEFGFDRLFFLSRDMRYTYEVYRELYKDDDARYLRISRKSLEFAKSNPGEFVEYLRKEQCYGNSAVVDTGWVGIAQVQIEGYCKGIDSSTDLGGLYMGVKKAYFNIDRSKRSNSCFFSTRYDQFRCSIMTSFWETLIGTNELKVIRYNDGIPIFDTKEYKDDRITIKFGADKFIADWLKFKNNRSIDPLIVRKAFERLFLYPSVDDINKLGKLRYEDTKYTDIISYDDKINYFVHPVKMISDLGDSAWKGAFLKKTGIISPILFGAYSILGPCRLYRLDIKKIRNSFLR